MLKAPAGAAEPRATGLDTGEESETESTVSTEMFAAAGCEPVGAAAPPWNPSTRERRCFHRTAPASSQHCTSIRGLWPASSPMSPLSRTSNCTDWPGPTSPLLGFAVVLPGCVVRALYETVASLLLVRVTVFFSSGLEKVRSAWLSEKAMVAVSPPPCARRPALPSPGRRLCPGNGGMLDGRKTAEDEKRGAIKWQSIKIAPGESVSRGGGG